MGKLQGLLLVVFVSCCYSYDWSGVDKVLTDAIADHAFPGCVALVGDSQGILYEKAFGHFTYGKIPPLNKDNPKFTIDTLFDLASCTKVTGATEAIAQFYQRGELDLFTRIGDILEGDYNQNGKTTITVLNCLLHNAGYPPDPVPDYWNPQFGCPETYKYHPLENFSCQDRIYNSLLAQTLINPVGDKYVYSDLSFITLQYVVGTLARDLGYIDSSDLIPGCDQGGPGATQCYFEAYLRKFVFEPLDMTRTGFLPPKERWPMAAPCENDTVYLHRVIQGQVSDGNAYALGGIAGHAGLFSNSRDLFTLMYSLMFAPESSDKFLNKTTVDLFIKEYNHTQSSRALGWNTNDPTVFDQGWNQSCGELMSPKTFTHVGYTGTQLCGDPDRKLITVFLTNRVYPSALNIKIRHVRQLFGNAVVRAFDAESKMTSDSPPKIRPKHRPQNFISGS